ncbi:MAG: chemotaxis protein CheW [Gammaproteobacteria bacterium]|nr:MAG: chemotaxis protein CheW [Gammaproteobacteria bacterium]
MTDQAHHGVVSLDDCWNRVGVWSSERASCPELERFVHCRNCDRYSAAGRQMLERPVPAAYRKEWTERFTHTKHNDEDTSKSVLLFRLGDEWLAIDSLFVNEITPVRTIHSLPHKSGTVVKGLVNIRGELKICISIGSILQLEKSRESYSTDHEILERMIFIEKDGQSFVFPVSEVYGIFHYANSALQATPVTVAKSKQNYTAGILCWDNQHVGVLDHELLFYALSRNLQ